MPKESWFKTYIYIWIGQFVSLLTSSAVNFAVIIYLSLHYKSAEVLAFAGIAGLLPQAIIGPFAGVYIDRWDRKKVMIYADAFIALCTFMMSFAFVEGEANLAFVYALLVCRSLGQAFHTPAMQAIAPLIVPEEKLLKVSGINQMLQSVSMIAGPAVGTLAITYMPISKVLYLDVIGAMLAIVSLMFVVIPKLNAQPTAENNISTVLMDLKLGFGEIHKNKGLYLLFVYAMLTTFFVMPVAIMYPLLTIEHFAGGKWEMSIIEVMWGAGMLVGGGILSAWKGSVSKVILVNAMHIFLGVTFVFSGWISGDLFWVFVAITTLGGIGMSFFNASFMTIIQEEIKPEFLGRVFSMYFSFAIIPSVIGLLFTGWIADEIGVVNAFIIGGSAMCFVGLLSFVTPAVMNLGKNRKIELSSEEEK
ncbi:MULTISPECIES: MFS transporter [Sphingobacterium]|uniref:MFS transporter n=1 Tax=Sphingobacterium litopenaei TaxID=2763500 RepID=A0ABR7YEV8_9SPHI|nr:MULTISPECIES: MFS transporter [Sphingobacterium]MBD1429849.1 MFS transporter [Sphingobacterium litopenaei]NGM73716.1 MFS transporter [Sphingobacterium sp. SGL-16]